MNCDPESSTANEQRNKHSFCNCDCEIQGLDRCINICDGHCDLCCQNIEMDTERLIRSQDQVEEFQDLLSESQGFDEGKK